MTIQDIFLVACITMALTAGTVIAISLFMGVH